jgi:flagellar basal-body rod protein FlgC
MDLSTSLAVAASGMRAQSTRMRIISENIANANSTASTPGGVPYRRQIATMSSDFDSELGATMANAHEPIADQSDFQRRYEPGNPAADKTGYVKTPNVNSLVEIMDMREAQQSYEADVDMMQASKSMLSQTIGLLNK